MKEKERFRNKTNASSWGTIHLESRADIDTRIIYCTDGSFRKGSPWRIPFPWENILGLHPSSPFWNKRQSISISPRSSECSSFEAAKLWNKIFQQKFVLFPISSAWYASHFFVPSNTNYEGIIAIIDPWSKPINRGPWCDDDWRGCRVIECRKCVDGET